MENVVTRAEVEQLIATAIEKRLQQAIEEFVQVNEIKLKELSLIDRVVMVEKELKALREISEAKFKISEDKFDLLKDEIAALHSEMAARFEASNERFMVMDKRFESLQREMSARFESVDKRLTTTQWMIGIFVGVPFFVMALIQVIQFLKY